MKIGILVFGEKGVYPRVSLVNSLLEEALSKGYFPNGDYDVSVAATQQSNANKQEIISVYEHTAQARGWKTALNFDDINICSMDAGDGSCFWLAGPRAKGQESSLIH